MYRRQADVVAAGFMFSPELLLPQRKSTPADGSKDQLRDFENDPRNIFRLTRQDCVEITAYQTFGFPKSPPEAVR
jgi:hypothetical protein